MIIVISQSKLLQHETSVCGCGTQVTDSVATLLLRKSTRFHDKETLDSEKKY